MTDDDKRQKHNRAKTVEKKIKITKKTGSDKDGTGKSDDPVKKMGKKLEAAEEEAKQSYEKYLRVSAEFENYKKRSLREMEEFRKFANESLIKEMLSVVDNLERAIDSSSDNEGAKSRVVEGIDMTLKEILKIFEKFAVKPIKSLGEKFDPTYHQAVSQEETDDYPDDTVTRELQRGYMLHGRLLRPAMVVVSTKSDNNNMDNIK